MSTQRLVVLALAIVCAATIFDAPGFAQGND